MNAEPETELAVSRIAAAIGEPARVRILYSLLDGHARTSTELATVAEVSPSTASVHLARLKTERLIKVFVQGKHRYYSLEGADVAAALEGLAVLAGGSPKEFVPNTPNELRAARSCYDHIAGMVGVALHNRFKELRWLACKLKNNGDAYELTVDGTKGFERLGINVTAARSQRRRFAYACLDWSERQPHIGGSLGAAILKTALNRRWMAQELDSRALRITHLGRRELLTQLGVEV
jgi:DNA-binding transcriptional ArsR family regulator